MFKRKLVKILHSVAALAYGGGIAAYLFVLLAAPEATDISQHLTLRTSLAFVSKWLIVPGMVVAVVSGLLAMMVHYPFMEQPWVWAKALSGLLIFEATLASIEGPASRAKAAAERAAAGELDGAELAALIHDEWTALWILLALAIANVVLGIWRPRFRGRSRPTSNEPWYQHDADVAPAARAGEDDRATSA